MSDKQRNPLPDKAGHVLVMGKNGVEKGVLNTWVFLVASDVSQIREAHMDALAETVRQNCTVHLTLKNHGDRHER